MPDLLVRNLSQASMDALKERAAKHRRSLQQEVLSILEACAEETVTMNPARIAATIRSRLTGSGRAFSDSAVLVREDRER